MPVEAQTVEYTYTGDGVSTGFPFPSRVLAASDIVVGVNGNLVTSGYEVSGVGADSGGVVTFTTPPEAGATVLLLRKPPISQLLDFVNGQSVLETTLDTGLDKLTMIAQYLKRATDRSLRLRDVEYLPAETALLLPSADERRGKMLGFAGTAGAEPVALTSPLAGTVTFEDTMAAYGASGDGVANDGPALAAALAAGKSVVLGADKTWNINIGALDVLNVLGRLDRVKADKPVDVKLPAGVFTKTAGGGPLVNVGADNGNVRLVGATPVQMSIVSIVSVAGSPHDWTVVVRVNSAVGVASGDVLTLFDVGPMAVLSGDNSVVIFDDFVPPLPYARAGGAVSKRPLKGEMSAPVVLTGTVTTVSGSGSAAFAGPFSYGPLSSAMAVGDLLTVAGQTRLITSVGASTVGITPGWAVGRAGERLFTVTRANAGTISAGGTTTVTGTGTAFTSDAEAGHMLLAEGELVEITAVASDTSLTLAKAITLAAGTPYSIIVPAVLHEGAHEVLSVAGNDITIKSRSYARPPVKGVTTGSAVAIKTVLRHAGATKGDDGLVFRQGATLGWVANVAIVGSRLTGESNGLAVNGRVDAGVFGDVTQQGYRADLLCGPNVAVTNWGRNVFLGHGCTLNGRGLFSSGAVSIGVWLMEGAFANLRRAVVSGSMGIGLAQNGGSGTLVTEARFTGNAGDGHRREVGATTYGEAPVYAVNGGMNLRVQNGGGGCDLAEGVSMLGLSGVYADGTDAYMPRFIFAAAKREGIEVVEDGYVRAPGAWVSGASGTAGVGNGVSVSGGGRANIKGGAVIGCKNIGLYATGDLSRITAEGAYVRRNLSRSARADARAGIAVANVNMDGAEVSGGGTVAHPGGVVSSGPIGVPRLNERQADGSLIADSSATAFGVNALNVNGGSNITFFKTGTVVFDCPSIPAGGVQFTDIAVAGALALGHTAEANSNSVPDGVGMSARVPANGTVRVFFRNTTGAAIDPGNATITWRVSG